MSLLSFSRKADYALVAVAELAREPGRRMSSARLAEATDAPESLLRNVLKDLARAGVLRAERGPTGGYWFDQSGWNEASGPSVLEIVQAVDGPPALARCCGPGESPEEDGCSHSPRCQIQHGMRLVHEGVVNVLRGVTVNDLIVGHGGGDAGGTDEGGAAGSGDAASSAGRVALRIAAGVEDERGGRG